MTRRAVAYSRVSTEEQRDEGISLEAQATRLRAYVSGRSLELAELVTDAAVSSSVPLAARHGGRRLLELVDSGGVELVVAVRLDRLFRNTVEAVGHASDWQERGVALHLLDLGGQAVDTSSAIGRHFFTMMAAQAEFERNLLRERIRETIRYAREAGIYWTRHVPFGYRKLGRGRQARYVPEPRQVGTVAELFRRYAAGETTQELAEWLAGEGIRSNTGEPWRPTALRRLLCNPIYIGLLHERVNGRHVPLREATNVDPIVDPLLWSAAQAQERAQRVGSRPRRSDYSPLAGHLVCGHCGARMHTVAHDNGPGRCYRYWRCGNYVKGSCRPPYLRDDEAWQLVADWLVRDLDPERIAAELTRCDGRQVDLDRRLVEVSAQLERLTGIYLRPEARMSEDEYLRHRGELLDQQAGLLAAKAPLPGRLAPLPPDPNERAAILAEMTIPERRALVRARGLVVTVLNGQVDKIGSR